MTEHRMIRFPKYVGTRIVEGGTYHDYRESLRSRWHELADAERERTRDERRRPTYRNAAD